MKKFITAAVLVGSFYFNASKSEAKPLRIAVMAVLDAGHYDQPVVDLFREIEAVSQNLSDWQIVSRREILDVALQQNLETQPMPMISIFQFQKGLKKSKTTEISVLQKILDNSEIQAAILVRCEPDYAQEVKSCGIYLYDRTAAKIVSASSKIFDQPISNTKVWATPLLTKLHQGLMESKVKKERDTLQNLFEEESAMGPRSLSFQASVGNSTVRDPNYEIKSVPYFKLGIGAQYESYGMHAVYGLARTKASPLNATVMYTDQCYGVNASARVRSLDTIYWGLEISALVNDRKVIRTDTTDTIGDGYQSDRSLKIALTPVLLWGLGESLLLGLEASIAKESMLSDSNTGIYQKFPVQGTGMSVGLRIQTVIR